ncbi:MAG: PBECR4 domain-containing protein [Lachnospiraceae bacterium]
MYSQNLAGKTYLYVYGNEYFEVSFPIDHFLHLTGIETRLSAKDFYKDAKKKLPCLKRLHARNDRLLFARLSLYQKVG